MSIAKSQTNSISNIFRGNRFVIPPYQRKYSWTNEERQALWDDIKDSLGSMNHFIGTLSFKSSSHVGLSTDEVYEIIDGQQRLTSIFILLNVLIEKIVEPEIRKDHEEAFIGTRKSLKVDPLGEDKEFITKLIFDFNSIVPDHLPIRSQRMLYEAKKLFIALSSNFTPADVEEWILYIRTKIEVLVFNVESQAQAVKMFSIINDRGLPLNILDKTKSTLMLYSTMYLNESLNKAINISFGHIFDSYDAIILERDKLGILLQFDEVTFYTQHYYSARKLFQEDWNYKIGADMIFKNLKQKLEALRTDPQAMTAFISDYLADFQSFSNSYAKLVQAIYQNKVPQKQFLFLEFTATLFPLIVRLFEQGKLTGLIDCLEKAEVRVFKLKGTNPRNNMYDLASQVGESDMTIEEIENQILDFTDSFMSDLNFRNALNEKIYRNASTKYILYEANGQNFTLDFYNNLQVEHIFAVTPTFGRTTHGFKGTEEYEVEIDKLGNLVLLEKEINRGIDNNSPQNKVVGYTQSKVKSVQVLAGTINQKSKYMKADVDTRREELIVFCLDRFKIR